MAKRRANGEGNIRKRKDGRWEGRYTAGTDPASGKAIIKNVLGKAQAEVKEKLKKAIAESGELDIKRSGLYTVGEWMDLWYEIYAKPRIRESTAVYYKMFIDTHIRPKLGDIKLNQLQTMDIQRLYNELREHGRTRKELKDKQPGLSVSYIRGIGCSLGTKAPLSQKGSWHRRQAVTEGIPRRRSQPSNPYDYPLVIYPTQCRDGACPIRYLPITEPWDFPNPVTG